MGWPDRRNVARASSLYRRGLMTLACLAGLVAVGLTLTALVAVPDVQNVIQRALTRSRAQANWTQFGYDASGTRNNPAEARVNTSTVAGLHLLWRTKLPDIADSTPALLYGLDFPDGSMHNVLYLTTKAGSLVALDADSGRRLWTRTNPTSDPNKPTTSSPAVDPSHHTVYSYGLDGRVHKYDAITGRELRSGGWPILVTNMRNTEKGSSALNIANGFLYVTTSSWGGDAPPFQGHVVVIKLSDGTTHVFNAICSDKAHLLTSGECRGNGAGIWARPGVVVDPVTGNIFFATGNGPYTADRGGHDWGDSVIELTRDGTSVVDAYTPSRPNDLYTQDLDLGSADPALLPAIPASKIPYLAVQAGKEGVLRLLNRQNLSGRGGPGYTGGELQKIDAPNHCPVLTQPAVWADPAGGVVWIFVASGCAIGGYQIKVSTGGKAALRLMWTVPVGATSPIIAGGVLFAATTGNKELLAINPTTGSQLWTSLGRHAGGSIGYTHWENPIVVDGHLYCTDENGELVAYGL